MILWLSATLLTAVVVGILIWPLVSRKRETTIERAAYDVAIFKDQLSEVTRDHERGLIDDAQASAAKLEVERRMLKAAEDMDTAQEMKRRHPLAAGLVTVLVTGGTLSVYLVLGSPELPDYPLAKRQMEFSRAQADAQKRTAEEMPQLVQAVEELQARLEKEPTNITALALLGSSLMELQRPGEAADAFDRAARLTNNDPEFLSLYAEALVFAAGGEVTLDARRAFLYALELAPKDPRAHFYLGMADARKGKGQAAIDRWMSILRNAPEGAGYYPMVYRSVVSVAERAGIDISAELANLPTPDGMVASGPTAADMAAAAQMGPEEQRKMIEGMVQNLADRLKENPADVPGWLQLIRSYTVLERREQAQQALNVALKAFDGNEAAVTALTGLADELSLER